MIFFPVVWSFRNFYPRPPRGGRRGWPKTQRTSKKFLSTPSARRATFLLRIPTLAERNFYPRPPRGGRQSACVSQYMREQISIHALREEGDSAARSRRFAPSIFLSTPSARRATAKTETKSLFSNKLYNILHEFRRALIYNGSKNYPNHAK